MAKGSVREKRRNGITAFISKMKAAGRYRRSLRARRARAKRKPLLRKAMEDYEAKRFVGKAENITVGEMLDLWIEEDLKPSSLSNGTVMAYTAAVKKNQRNTR